MSPRTAPGPRAPELRTSSPRPAAVPPGEPLVAALHQRLAGAFAGLAFPAARWRAVTEAEWYGCDGVTRSMLERLPTRTYVSFPDLVNTLATVLAGPAAPAPQATAARRPGPAVDGHRRKTRSRADGRPPKPSASSTTNRIRGRSRTAGNMT